MYLKLLHFSHYKKEQGKTDYSYNHICKMWTIFDMLDDSYVIYYSPTEQLAVDKITVLIKGRIIFKQCTLNEHTKYSIT